MLAAKRCFFLLMIFTSLNVWAMEKRTVPSEVTTQATKPRCPTKEACLNDPECLCWCSQMCDWRKKTPDDHPYYVENDKFGKFCYCKKWDYDYYEANCIQGRKVKQPKGAQ